MKKINCRICNSSTAELVVTFKNSPLEMWPTTKKLKDKKKDLEVYVCKVCGLTQLQRFSANQVKSFYDSGSCVLCDSMNIKDRFRDIDSVYKKAFFKNSKIMDIGGGRNNILGFFNSHEKWICDVNAAPNPTRYTKNDKYLVKIPKSRYPILYYAFFRTQITGPLAPCDPWAGLVPMRAHWPSLCALSKRTVQ